ncbi:MAG: hypothetical protein ACHWZW_13855 [Spirulina sp.]
MTRPQIEPWQTADGVNGETSSDTAPGSAMSADAPATAAALALAPQAASSPGGSPIRPRPWRQRLRWGAGLLALGGVGYGLWALLRPPLRPYVLDVSPSASQYAVTEQETPLLNWQISHPRQVESLIVRTLSAEGSLVGEPQSYDLSGPLPVELLAYCSQTRQRLTCQNVPTQVRQPGQYRFEITLLPKASLNLPPVQATSSLVTLTQRPMPIALELVPQQVIYSEAGTPVSANTPTLAPPVTGNGVTLSWIVTHPEVLQDLLLVVRDPGGTTLGGRRFSLRNPENPTQITLPEELQPFCQLGQHLVCQGVPTGMVEVGQYQFELTPIPMGLGETEAPITKVSEVVEIQPRPIAITAFRINGREAAPKYPVPVEPGQPIPGFQLDWQVEGGSTAQVELLPSPGTVGKSGSLRLPLAHTGTTTLTLRVSDGQNPPIVRAVTFETFNPNPNPPPVIINPEGQRTNAPPSNAPRSNPPAENAPASRPPSPAQPPRSAQPNLSLPESVQSQPPTLPEDLRNRDPEDLNLQF